MNSMNAQQTALEPAIWNFLNTVQLYELSSAHYSGDNQHRAPIRVRLQRRDKITINLPTLNLRIETSEREDGSGERFNFTGRLETSHGLVQVEGFIRVLTHKGPGFGQLRVMQSKRCPTCPNSVSCIRPRAEKRCQDCGSLFQAVTPALVA